MENSLKDIVVLYHAHCQDGFGAAFAAYKKFGDNASYIPCKGKDRIETPIHLENKEIYIVDYSFSKETLHKLERTNKKLVVIDHHYSVKDDVMSIKEYVYSDEHSGAYLSWQYFVSNDVPEFIKILEMIDMHKDEGDMHKDVITYILSKPLTFENYEELLKDFNNEESLTKIKALGKSQNDYLNVIVESFLEDPDFVEFEGYTVPCINMSLPINEKSIVMHRLYMLYPPFSMSYRIDKGLVKVSLRGNGEVDLSAFAVKYGGGGHKNSCGFVVKTDFELPFAKRKLK